VYHSRVPTPDRYALLAKLPEAGPFTRYLAIERGAVPRAVVAYVTPAAVSDDPGRLAALSRDTECAARLRHAHVVPPLVVEAYRSGVTLREVLDAGGRLSPPVAARIAADVCAALERVHGFVTGDGKPLAHGAVGPDRVWIADGGEALLCGLGTGGGVDPVEDVRGAAAVLGECLSGEPAGERFDAPGVPPAVASVVSRYRSAASAVLGPAALSEAVAAAVKPGVAAHETVAAWVDAVLPPGRGVRVERGRLLEEALGPDARFGGAAAGSRGKAGPGREESKGTPAPLPAPGPPPEEVVVDQIIDPASLRAMTVPMLRAVTDEDIVAMTPAPTPPSVPAPLPTDAARTFPTPAHAPDRTHLVAIVAAAFAVAGFALGFGISRTGPSAAVPAPPPAVSVPLPPPPAPAPAPAAKPTKPAGATAPARKEPARVRPKSAAAVPAAVTAQADGRPGVLTVNAPEGATVLLDGKALGVGPLKRDVAPGRHDVEIRLGDARVSEAFEMLPGGTYTYDVTPTGP
jgi:hypothetical protein